ncbi:hypothetical protein FPQ18DRAFT_307131 [Pyronema domesticum]|nr:hypothetical protein FPQ18DRAFT_307131 [Pyronema domesticum]
MLSEGDTKLANYLDEVMRLQENADWRTSMGETRTMNMHVSKLQALLHELDASVLRYDHKLDKITEIIEVPYMSRHNTISEKRLENSVGWLFDRTEYKEWTSCSSSKLLLLRVLTNGLLSCVLLARAGKTYITSKVVDGLKESLTSDTEGGAKFAYFYCNRAEESRRDPTGILCALIQQLAAVGRKNVLQPVFNTQKERANRGQACSSLTLGESENLLIQIVNIYPQCIICIDVLDEIDSQKRSDVLKALLRIIEESNGLVKIFVTACNEVDIIHQFKEFPHIELQPEDNISDIERFIKKKTNKDCH